MDARDTPSKGVCFLFGVSLHQGACRRGSHKGGAAPSPPGDRQELPEMGGFSRLWIAYVFEFIFRQKAHYFCQKCCNIRPFCYNG